MPDTAPPRLTERDMLDRLNTRYGKFNGNGIRYTRAEHVKVTAGFDARRVCDYMAMDLWSSAPVVRTLPPPPLRDGLAMAAGPYLHGHEVKVSRSDWLTELRDLDKSWAFRRYCDYWWLVVSDKSIVRPGELPDGWGLMVAQDRAVNAGVGQAPRACDEPQAASPRAGWSNARVERTVRVARQAAFNADAEPMPRHLQATLTRAVTKTALRLAAVGDPAMAFLDARRRGH